MESGSSIFKTEWHNLVCQSAPRGGECNFVSISMSYLNLVIPWEFIHEREGFVSCASIDDLVDELGRVVVFWTRFFQISEISTDMNVALCFHDGNRVGNPWCVRYGVDKLSFVNLVDFSLNWFYLRWVQLTLFLVYRWYVRRHVNMVLYDSGTKPWNFWIIPWKYVSIFLQLVCVRYYFIWRTCCPQWDFRDFFWISRDSFLDGWWNIGHVPFFECVGRWGGIFELVKFPKWKEIFLLDCIYLMVFRFFWAKFIFRKKKWVVMHCIP